MLSSKAKSANFKYIPRNKLAVSEPNPRWFGNPSNEINNSKWTQKNWLKSRFHFSFAEYYNYKNTNFGVLRVMNDDLVQPKRGFGSHPHTNAEIVTYIVEGKLTHKDSMHTSETLGPGSIQFMTAGSGVVHSEHNLQDEPLRFIQMWLNPKQRGLKPNYGSMCGSKCNDKKNKWNHLVSSTDTKIKTPVEINTDVNIYVAKLEEGSMISKKISSNRQAYVLAVDGTPTISTKSDGEQKMRRHDAAELYGEEEFTFKGPGHVLLVEMEKDGSGGRKDL